MRSWDSKMDTVLEPLVHFLKSQGLLRLPMISPWKPLRALGKKGAGTISQILQFGAFSLQSRLHLIFAAIVIFQQKTMAMTQQWELIGFLGGLARRVPTLKSFKKPYKYLESFKESANPPRKPSKQPYNKR